MPPIEPVSNPLIEQSTDHVMRLMAGDVSKYLSASYGFMIMVFPFDGRHACSYISNTNRGDMIRALREQANVLERKDSIVTPAEAVKQ